MLCILDACLGEITAWVGKSVGMTLSTVVVDSQPVGSSECIGRTHLTRTLPSWTGEEFPELPARSQTLQTPTQQTMIIHCTYTRMKYITRKHKKVFFTLCLFKTTV